MANLSYLTLTGEKQGKISAGCCSLDSVGNKAQLTHIDQIMVYALMHSITRDQNANHHELIIFKFSSFRYTKVRYNEILKIKYIKVITTNTWLFEKPGKYIFNSRAPKTLEMTLGWRGGVSEAIKNGLIKQQEMNVYKMKSLSPFMYMLTSIPAMGTL